MPHSGAETVRLMAVGDMLIHTEIINGARTESGYDFSGLFVHMKPVFAGADLVIANQETLVNDRIPPSGFPQFSTPGELAQAELDAGIRAVTLASNHTLDHGARGMDAAMELWGRHPEMTITGVGRKGAPGGAAVVDVKGVSVALLNYTAPTNFHRNPRSGDYAVELLRDNRREEIARQIREAAKAADIVLVFPHWGVEYLYEPNGKQRTWAQFFADNGADAVIGTHPHVLQSMEVLTAPDGRKVPCWYSLGNFVSCQKRPATMLGGLAELEIERPAGGRARIAGWSLLPLVSHADRELRRFAVYPLSEYTEALAAENGVFPIVREDWNVETTVPYLRELFDKICEGTAQRDNPFRNRTQVLWYNIRRYVKIKLTRGTSAGRL